MAPLSAASAACSSWGLKRSRLLVSGLVGVGVTIAVLLAPTASANCGTMTCDATGNGHSLTAFGDPASRESPEPKYANGSNLDGTDDRLEVSQDAGLAITGDLSLVVAFEVDDFARFDRLLDVREPSTGDHIYSILYNGNRDRLVYRHTDGSGNNENFFVTDFQSRYGTGLHTLTVRRDAATTNVVVKVDGTTEINDGYGSVDGASEADLALGAATGGGAETNVSVYELRVWDALVAQSTLDEIADPADPSFEDAAEGSETALWFLGPAGQILFSDHFNDGTVDTTKWTADGAAENATCGHVSTPYSLHFAGDRLRQTTTRDLNVSGGGTVEFYLRFASGPCNDNLDRDVTLNYSTDGGSSWTTMTTYDDATATSWTLFQEPIPAEAATSSTRFRWWQGNTSGQHWMLDDVTVDGSGGGGGNSAPTADFTDSCTNLNCTFNGSVSVDEDGSIISYDWDFGDGSTGSGQIVNHTYACDGTFTVGLTVTDDDGATDSTAEEVTVSDVDTDGDGLSDCTEKQGGINACGSPWSPTNWTLADTDGDGLWDGDEVRILEYCTSPNDPDTDDDEFSDREEVDPVGSSSYFGFTDAEAEDVFCGSGGSPCAYPTPHFPDIYFEIDGIEDHCGPLTGCDTHLISPEERDHVVEQFQDQDIRAHFDLGQFSTKEEHGGQIVASDEDLKETANWSYMENTIQDNGSYFDSRRAGIFHHMFAVHDLEDGGDTPCGIGEVNPLFTPDGRADFSGLAHGHITDGHRLSCRGLANDSWAIRSIVLEEFGHNFFGVIEPHDDQCDQQNDTLHDTFGDWAMDGATCDPQKVNADYFDPANGNHRWFEAQEHVAFDPAENECDDSNRNDPLKCPSPGDLNNGIAGKQP